MKWNCAVDPLAWLLCFVQLWADHRALITERLNVTFGMHFRLSWWFACMCQRQRDGWIKLCKMYHMWTARFTHSCPSHFTTAYFSFQHTTLFFFLTHTGCHLTQLLFFLIVLLSSPWRLCGLQLGPLNQFCPASRSRPFSTRCLSSETCTKRFTQVWKPVWVLMTRLRSALVTRQK